MNQTEELRQAITDLFLTGTDNDHDGRAADLTAIEYGIHSVQ